MSDKWIKNVSQYSASNETIKIFDISFERGLDLFGAAIIWCLATFAAVMGGYWSGSVRLENYLVKISKVTLPSKRSPSNPYEEIADLVDIIYKYIEQMDDLIIFGVVLTIFVIIGLLFYRVHEMAILILGTLYYVLTTASFVICLAQIFRIILPERLSKPNFPFCRVTFYKIVLLIFGMSLTFICLWNRLPWKINNFLGVCICVFIIKVFRLPSLRICLIYLWSFLAIDVFMVFIIPLLTTGM